MHGLMRFVDRQVCGNIPYFCVINPDGSHRSDLRTCDLLFASAPMNCFQKYFEDFPDTRHPLVTKYMYRPSFVIISCTLVSYPPASVRSYCVRRDRTVPRERSYKMEGRDLTETSGAFGLDITPSCYTVGRVL